MVIILNYLGRYHGTIQSVYVSRLCVVLPVKNSDHYENCKPMLGLRSHLYLRLLIYCLKTFDLKKGIHQFCVVQK